MTAVECLNEKLKFYWGVVALIFFFFARDTETYFLSVNIKKTMVLGKIKIFFFPTNTVVMKIIIGKRNYLWF